MEDGVEAVTRLEFSTREKGRRERVRGRGHSIFLMLLSLVGEGSYIPLSKLHASDRSRKAAAAADIWLLSFLPSFLPQYSRWRKCETDTRTLARGNFQELFQLSLKQVSKVRYSWRVRHKTVFGRISTVSL